MPRHRDSAHSLPSFPMGRNSNASVFAKLCPRRDYVGCFSAAMTARYPSLELFGATGWPRREDPLLDAAAHAARLHRSCAVFDARTSSPPPSATPALQRSAGVANSLADSPEESFTSSALRGTTSTRLAGFELADRAALRSQLREASHRALISASDGRLRCGSSSRQLDERLLVLIGLPIKKSMAAPHLLGRCVPTWLVQLRSCNT